jgi:hypothetical protein
MRSPPKRPYRGTLVRPINYDTYLSVKGSSRSPKNPTMVFDKLTALCRYYGVPPANVNREHVLTLAGRYVPGFQIARVKQRRHKRWDDLRLAQLWVHFRSARRNFSNDEIALANIAKDEDFRQITGNVKLVWVKQLLDRARLSPLVQMLESKNPCDNDFAQKFLSKHVREKAIP